MIPQESKTIDFGQLYSLTEAQRLDARQVARQNVIKRAGPQPQRAQFKGRAESEYSPIVRRVVITAMLILLGAAFIPSAHRVFELGMDTYSRTIRNASAGEQAGYAFVLLAESGMIGFTLAAGVLNVGKGARRAMWVAAGISTMIALVFNVQLALGARWFAALWQDPAAWIEAYAPPILVIFSANVLKSLLLDSDRQHHAERAAYEAALADWRALTDDPESAPTWRAAYMNALKQALIRANTETGTGPGLARRREIVAAMNAHDWRQLVERELRADDWTALPAVAPDPAPGMTAPVGQYAPPIAQDDHYPLAAGLPIAAGNHNGNICHAAGKVSRLQEGLPIAAGNHNGNGRH